MSCFRRTATVFAFAIFCSMSNSNAQSVGVPPELKPVDTRDFVVSAPELGQHEVPVYYGRINFKPNISPRDKRYYFAPYVGFLRESGKLKIATGESLNAGRKTVTLFVRVNRQDLPSIVRRYLIQSLGQESAIQESQVQPVPLTRLSFETAGQYQPKIKFDSFVNPQPASPLLPLNAEASPTEIEKFVRDLEAGAVSLQVNFAFDGASFQENAAVLKFEDIQSTKVFTTLSGAGAPANVSRNQVLDLAQQAVKNVQLRAGSEYAADDVDKIVDKVLAIFEVQQKKIDTGWNGLRQQFEELGFDANTFKADIITASKNRNSGQTHDQFLEKVNEATKDDDKSFNLFTNFIDKLDVGWADKDKERQYSREVFTEVMKKWGIESEFSGTKFEPKNIAVSRNNVTKLQSDGTLNVSLGRFVGGEQSIVLLSNALTSIVDGTSEAPLSEQISQTQAALVPVGGVVMFWGSRARVPQNYELCDGKAVVTEGSPIFGQAKPNLIDRFAKGAVDSADVATSNVSGGTNSIPASVTGDVTLTVDQMPSHAHATSEEPHAHNWAADAMWRGQPGQGGAGRKLKFPASVGMGPNPNQNSGPLVEKVVALPQNRIKLDDFDGSPVSGEKTNLKIVANGGGKPHAHSLPAEDNRPAFTEVFFIIRVR